MSLHLFLARSANLLEGLYILHMFFLYFFLYIFNGRHSTTCCLEANGLIFTKISGLVDGWKGLLPHYIFFRFLKGRCHGNQLKSKNQRFSSTNLLCRTVIPKWIAV